MTERRDVLRMASVLPLGILAASPALAEENQAPGADPGVNTSTEVRPAAPPEPLPQTQPPTKNDFSDYHLLGKPDTQANLFGGHRPQDWKATKTALQSALQSAAERDDPIHDWLNTFTPSFDDRAVSIIVGAKPNLYSSSAATQLRYEPQLYDATLRGAAALLDRCLRYRTDMGEFEVSGVSAGLSYLTFIKTKPLQRNFLEKSNNADLAKLEHDTDLKASKEIGRIWGLLRLFESHQLRAEQAELAGSAAGADLEAKKFDFLSEILAQQFNIQSDAQLAQFTRLLTPGSASNFAEKYLRQLSLLTEDISDAYSKLYSAALGIQAVIGLTQISIGQNPPTDLQIPSFSSADDVAAWVKRIAPQTDEQRKPDLLDALVLWCRAVIRTLDTQAQFESEFNIAIPLNQPWGTSATPILTPKQISDAFSAANPTGTLSFTLPASAIPVSGNLRAARVTGIGLSVEYSTDDQSPLQYTSDFPHGVSGQEPTPDQVAKALAFEVRKMARLNATLTSPPQSFPGGTPYSRPKLFVSNIRLFGGNGGDLEPTLSYDLACRGLNPFGSWTIAFDRNALEYFQSGSALTDSKVMGVVLHLRLRGSLS